MWSTGRCSSSGAAATSQTPCRAEAASSRVRPTERRNCTPSTCRPETGAACSPADRPRTDRSVEVTPCDDNRRPPTIADMDSTCTHLDTVADVEPSSQGCEDCLRIGGEWVHLRMCQTCGHVGCCDNSPNRHA